jgi:hypothetical protein
MIFVDGISRDQAIVVDFCPVEGDDWKGGNSISALLLRAITIPTSFVITASATCIR